jgi:hypothetical protein
MSAAANVLRVAKTARSLTELVRIATGEPRADAVPHPPDAGITVWASPDCANFIAVCNENSATNASLWGLKTRTTGEGGVEMVGVYLPKNWQ